MVRDERRLVIEQGRICEYESSAWLMDGNGPAIAGWMCYQQGELTFWDSCGDQLFSAHVSELKHVRFPWYYFGTSMTLETVGMRLRVAFVSPHGRPSTGRTRTVWDHEESAVPSQLQQWRGARIASRTWRSILSGDPLAN